METFSNNICKLKREFVKSYKGNSHTTEILPNSTNDFIKIECAHLSLLHKFLEVNPIYSKQKLFSFFQLILDQLRDNQM